MVLMGQDEEYGVKDVEFRPEARFLSHLFNLLEISLSLLLTPMDLTDSCSVYINGMYLVD